MAKIIFIFIIPIFLYSCKKSKSSKCYYSGPPPTFFFTIKQNGQILPADVLNNIKVSYFEEGIKKYVNDIYQATNYYANKGVLTTRTAGILSADHNIKTFFIEYPKNISTDTVQLDYETYKPSNNCLYTVKQVTLNNVVSVINTFFQYQPVYLFSKD